MARFLGEVRTEWLRESDDDRRMRLLEDFVFEDDTGKRWSAPAGFVIDGASIPALLWSSQGSPYVGDYRRASVVHDVYCVTKSEPHKAVHRMFYDAMLCDGVGSFQAKKMYAAVRLFGPSWGIPGAAVVAGLEGAAAAERTGPPIDDLDQVLDTVLGE